MIPILSDRYEVKQQLSRKAGRQTFVAIDHKAQNPVVVKLLTFSAEFEWDDLKLFEREIQVLKNLNHRAIPKYLDSFEVDLPDCKGFALVQEFINAPSLEIYLQAGRTCSETEVKQIAEALLEILTYLHDQKPPVIHRDIKPSNVLLANRSGNHVGQVFLVDFGSVQTLMAKDTGTFTIVGTYGYMPPEQFLGRTVPSSDLYSLGATLVYLVTGQHPAALITDDLDLEFTQSPTLSPELTRWLQRMVQAVPNKRFANAREALQALKKPQLTDDSMISAVQLAGKTTSQDSTPSDATLQPKVQTARPTVLPKEKPANSKIQLTKQHNTLKILFSRRTTWRIVIFYAFICVFVPPLSFGYFLMTILSWLGYWIFDALDLAELREIVVNQSSIHFKYKLFGLTIRRSYPRQQLFRLQLVKACTSTSPDGSISQQPNKIMIWLGALSIPMTIPTDVEMTWLSQELSEWLNVPITQIGQLNK